MYVFNDVNYSTLISHSHSITFPLFIYNRDRLSASDMINVKKVIEHVYEKVLGQGSDAGSQAANSSPHEKESEREDEHSFTGAEERVELLCIDQVSIFYLYSSLRL